MIPKASAFLVIFLFLLAGGVFALELEGLDDEDFCSAVKRLIQEGNDAYYVVTTGIEVDTGPCNVVKCAYEGGGDLALIIAGALSMGASSDSMTACLIEAGAEPAAVATALEKSGEIRTVEAAMATGHLSGPAIIAGPPGGEGVAGIAVSPSGF